MFFVEKYIYVNMDYLNYFFIEIVNYDYWLEYNFKFCIIKIWLYKFCYRFI